MTKQFNIPAGKFAGEEYQQYAEPTNYGCGRNGFITFWLWLGVIGSIISGIFGSITVNSYYSNLGYYEIQLAAAGVDFINAAHQIRNATNILVITSVVSAICCLVGYIKLIEWKKAGFWIIIVQAIIFSCINLYAMGKISEAYAEIGLYLNSNVMTITQVVGSFISWILLWAILHIKKNGISCWSQLD